MATTNYQQLHDGNPDGCKLGVAATDLVGLYGVTPVDQAATFTSVITTAATSTTNAYGYTTAAQADAIVTAVNAIITALEDIGIAAQS